MIREKFSVISVQSLIMRLGGYLSFLFCLLDDNLPDNVATINYRIQNVARNEATEYLGVLLHRRLNWSKHCEAMRGKALMSLGKLIPLLKSNYYSTNHTFGL